MTRKIKVASIQSCLLTGKRKQSSSWKQEKAICLAK